MTTLHQARSTAVTRNTTLSACPSSDSQRCASADTGWDGGWDGGWIAFVDRNADLRRDGNEELQDQVRPAAGIRIATASFGSGLSYSATGAVSPRGAGDFRFGPDGAAMAPRAVILGANGQPRLIETERSGKSFDCPTD